MRQLIVSLLVSAGVAAASSAAWAADIPLKAPVRPAEVAVFSWTGFYFGGNVGWARDQQEHDRVVANSTFPAGTVVSDTLSGSIIGAQGGFNLQFSQFLIGVEADWMGGRLTGTDTAFSPCPAAPGCINLRISPGRSTVTDRVLDGMADVTGRAGFVYDRTLIYAKGGVVWAKTSSVARTFSSTGTLLDEEDSDTTLVRGRLIGGGLEWMPSYSANILANMSFKIEYDYIRLDTSTGCSTSVAGVNSTGLTVCGHQNNENTVQIIKGGINLMFMPWSGGGMSSVSSRY